MPSIHLWLVAPVSDSENTEPIQSQKVPLDSGGKDPSPRRMSNNAQKRPQHSGLLAFPPSPPEPGAVGSEPLSTAATGDGSFSGRASLAPTQSKLGAPPVQTTMNPSPNDPQVDNHFSEQKQCNFVVRDLRGSLDMSPETGALQGPHRGWGSRGHRLGLRWSNRSGQS